MITLARLSKDVLDFLDTVAYIQVELGVRSYIVNDIVYSETNEPGIYMVTTLEAPMEIGKA